MQKYLFLIMIMSLIAGFSYGQNSKVWSETVEVSPDRENKIVTNGQFNGVTIVFEQDFIPGLKISADDNKIFELTLDEHMEDRIQANLVFLNNPVNSFSIKGITNRASLRIYYQYVPVISSLPGSEERRAGCESPGIVPQSVWRAGLEGPVQGRSKTVTRHCIVHHSASSNTDTNSINLVRAFYIQHKDINGWDDIGYNYLIGYDGTVFAGRDPERQGIDQDNVLGAHFCGKNSFTMGICVIGYFEAEAPDQRAISSLEQLLTWKMYKDKLNPLDSLHHPDTINGDLLPVLGGHRNGCATTCPGQILFDRLPEIRAEILDNINECGPLSISKSVSGKILAYPSPSNHLITLEVPGEGNLRIFDMSGRMVYDKLIRYIEQVDVSLYIAGIYIVEFTSDAGHWMERVIVGGG